MRRDPVSSPTVRSSTAAASRTRQRRTDQGIPRPRNSVEGGSHGWIPYRVAFHIDTGESGSEDGCEVGQSKDGGNFNRDVISAFALRAGQLLHQYYQTLDIITPVRGEDGTYAAICNVSSSDLPPSSLVISSPPGMP